MLSDVLKESEMLISYSLHIRKFKCVSGFFLMDNLREKKEKIIGLFLDCKQTVFGVQLKRNSYHIGI